MTNEKSLNELLAEDAYLFDMIKTLTEQRDNLPRSDKQGAHNMMAEINRMSTERRKLKPSIARMREVEEKRENHSLWVSCIKELYGEEDLALCFEWMKQEKKRRKQNEHQCVP